MKKYIKFFTLTAVALGLVSCVQDLNTEPINPNVVQEFDQDDVHYKIYDSISHYGQKRTDEDNDIMDKEEDN